MTLDEATSPEERFLNWLAHLPWIPLSLIYGVGLSLTTSLQQAAWLYSNTAYINAVWLGLACGAALAASRFRGRLALAYSLCLSLVGAGEFAGDITRGLWMPNPLWNMHLRLDLLVSRIYGWGVALLARQPVFDTGFFAVCAGWGLWNLCAWLTWNLMRRRQTLPGLLPLALVLAINTHLSNQSPLMLAAFAGVGTLLCAYTAYTASRLDWDRRQVDYPTEAGLAWGFSAAIIAIALFLTAQTAVLVGTPKGWQTIGNFFYDLQKQSADLASRLFPGVNPPRSPTLAPRSTSVAANSVVSTPTPERLSAAFPPNLELIGDVPEQSTAPVMWVQLSDPAPLPPDLHVAGPPLPQHYWRIGLFDTYTGRGWDPLSFSPEGQAPTAPAGRYPLLQRFEIAATHTNQLFAVNLPISASAAATVTVHLRYTPLGDSAQLEGDASHYEVMSWATNATAGELEAAQTDYPAEIRQKYLQLPPTLPQRVSHLALQVTTGAATPYAKALKIQEYLRLNYTYTLKVPPPPPGQDAVDYFLFAAPGGFCSYYASAMAVMLRVNGVPARVATGFAMGVYDFKHAAYRVSNASAHAWVEVYFPAYGWVEFEPTPARQVFTYAASQPLALPTPTPTPAPNWLKDFNWQLPLLVVGLALVAGLGLNLIRFFLSLEPGWHTPRGQARALYRQIRQGLAQAGFEAPGHLTPLEYLAAHQASLAGYPALRTALSAATQLYLRATFSGHSPAASETRRTGSLWLRAQWEWFRAWLGTARRSLAQTRGPS